MHKTANRQKKKKLDSAGQLCAHSLESTSAGVRLGERVNLNLGAVTLSEHIVQTSDRLNALHNHE